MIENLIAGLFVAGFVMLAEDTVSFARRGRRKKKLTKAEIREDVARTGIVVVFFAVAVVLSVLVA